MNAPFHTVPIVPECVRDYTISYWNGSKWVVTSDWYQADKTLIDPLVKEYADKYAKDKNIQVRSCS